MQLDGIKHRVVPFHQRHIHMANFRSFEKEVLEGYGRPHIEDYGVEGLSFTAIRNAKVIVIWGLYPLWKGVAEAWMLPTHDLETSKMIFHKGALRFFEHATKKLELHRLQTYVCSTNYRAVKWMEMCYFDREGLLKRYGPDIKDYYVYGRLFKWVVYSVVQSHHQVLLRKS